MSFFDDEDDLEQRPTRRSGGAAVSRDQLLMRRVLAGLAGVVVLALLLFGIRGCLDARKESSIRGYIADVTDLMNESTQGASELFETMDDPSELSPLDFENAIKANRSGAANLVERAQEESVPGDMSGAHEAVVLALELRRDALERIADEVGTALGREGRREATNQIAAQMQAFLASDVIFSQRALPAMRSVLQEEEIEVERLPRSQSLPDVDWLNPRRVTEALGKVRGEATDDDVPEGTTRGTALTATIANPGGITLEPGGQATVPADATLQAQVQNQGEVDEPDITVVVRISGGDEPIEIEKTVSEIAVGETAEVNIPISPRPPTGRPLEVEVEVEAVPGEAVLENNSATYTVTFE